MVRHRRWPWSARSLATARCRRRLASPPSLSLPVTPRGDTCWPRHLPGPSGAVAARWSAVARQAPQRRPTGLTSRTPTRPSRRSTPTAPQRAASSSRRAGGLPRPPADHKGALTNAYSAPSRSDALCRRARELYAAVVAGLLTPPSVHSWAGRFLLVRTRIAPCKMPMAASRSGSAAEESILQTGRPRPRKHGRPILYAALGSRELAGPRVSLALSVSAAQPGRATPAAARIRQKSMSASWSITATISAAPSPQCT